MKKILFAASEAVPFMKTGGLADVTGSLPKYFDKKNYDVRVILPKYVCMEERWKGQLHFLCHFYVNLSWRKQYVGIFETTYDGITYYLVDNEFYFAGNAPYNNIYEDVEKFAFFSKAVLEHCRILISVRISSTVMTGRRDCFRYFCVLYMEMRNTIRV